MVPWYVKFLAVGALTLSLVFLLDAELSLPDHSLADGVPQSYTFGVENAADGPIAYTIRLDGETVCRGELGASWWTNEATCTTSTPYDDSEHSLLITIHWDNGRQGLIHGETTTKTTMLRITNFGADRL